MRLTFGAQFPGVDVPVPVLPDIALAGVSADARTVVLNVPTFDGSAVGVPTTVHACYLSAAPDPSASAVDVLASAPFSANVPFPGVAGDFPIVVPNVPPGTYFVQVILEFPL